MARYDVVVIGAGLGGLTAGAILAREGRKVLVIERGNSVGGAASSYKAGDLFIEASLHKTSGPEDVRDPKHRALTRAGVTRQGRMDSDRRDLRGSRRAAARAVHAAAGLRRCARRADGALSRCARSDRGDLERDGKHRRCRGPARRGRKISQPAGQPRRVEGGVAATARLGAVACGRNSTPPSAATKR